MYILPIGILHGLQGHDLVARGVDDFDAVANSKAVFHLYLQPTIARFGFADLAHELAALRLRTAGFVVLVGVGRATLQKAGGIAPVAQAFQLGNQLGVEWSACHGIVDGAAVNLRRAADVIQAFGAPFDLERIHADPGQALHILYGAQILAVHDVGAVLVFHDGHQFARATNFFDQVHLVGQRVAHAIACGGWLAAAGGKVFFGAFALGLEIEIFFELAANGIARVAVHIRLVRGVIPAASIGASALIGITPVEVAAEQAAPAVGNAQRAVHEHFQLHIGAFLPDFFHFVQA